MSPCFGRSARKKGEARIHNDSELRYADIPEPPEPLTQPISMDI